MSEIIQKNDVGNYIPTIGMKAQKLIQNAWPGPLTIVFELDKNDIDKQNKNLDGEVFESLYKDNSIGIRCPDNTIAAMLLRQTSFPVVAPSANITDSPPAVNPGQVLEQLSGKIDLLLDAGPCKYKQSSTVVKIGKKGMGLLRPGVYSQAELEALSQIQFLFVCTGNTCRSPMAEGIFRKYLAEKFQCNLDGLDKMGYKITSAGIIGSVGYPATAEAVAACAAKGIDRVIIFDPKAVNKCFLLAGNTGIPDPIGHPQQSYDKCAKLIERAVQKRISEFVK